MNDKKIRPYTKEELDKAILEKRGYVISRNSNETMAILYYDSKDVYFARKGAICRDIAFYGRHYEDAVDEFTWLDGTPFGVTEGERTTTTKAMQIWGARDEHGELFAFEEVPYKDFYEEEGGTWMVDEGWYTHLPDNFFPEIQWSDKEPTKLTITLTTN